MLVTGTKKHADALSITPVRLGGRHIGSLGLQGKAPMTETVVEAIANLAAISIERARAIERVTMAEASKKNEELRAATLRHPPKHKSSTTVKAVELEYH